MERGGQIGDKASLVKCSWYRLGDEYAGVHCETVSSAVCGRSFTIKCQGGVKPISGFQQGLEGSLVCQMLTGPPGGTGPFGGGWDDRGQWKSSRPQLFTS